MPPGSFYKPAFLEFMREEHNACREGVGIIDISSFSKIEITVSPLILKIFHFFLGILIKKKNRKIATVLFNKTSNLMAEGHLTVHNSIKFS